MRLAGAQACRLGIAEFRSRGDLAAVNDVPIRIGMVNHLEGNSDVENFMGKLT